MIETPHILALITAGLILIPPVSPGQTQEDKKPKADAHSAAKKVDAIVNRNKAPKVVTWTGDWTRRAALFPEDHDWNEETRARKAISELGEDQTEEVWEELVKRLVRRGYDRPVRVVVGLL